MENDSSVGKVTSVFLTGYLLFSINLTIRAFNLKYYY